MRFKKITRKEVPGDRGKYKGTSFKKISPGGFEFSLTARKKARLLEIKREIVSVSQATDNPVTFDETDRVMRSFTAAVTNLLVKFGEVDFVGLGTMYNLFIGKDSSQSRKYQSSDENGKKKGYRNAYIRTLFRVSDKAKASMNGRKTHQEQIKENKTKSQEKRRIKERDSKEEDAALALIQLWEVGGNIDTHLDNYWELIYWNDFSCYHTINGTKLSQLPVRREGVRDRFLAMLVDIEGGSRYIKVWDQYMSIPALEARGITPEIDKWPGHDWSAEGYWNWSNRIIKGD